MSGEELYKKIASSGGAGLRELAAKPDQYSNALKNNEVLHPQDLDGFDVANSALSILEDADALVINGGLKSYEVTDEYSEEEIEEAFEMLEEYREHLF
ncbi:hypothetical protein GKQ38_02565 [Candidatus Nanohaloarchaea archaeon]|nr:hypothetical protein GKQ38_02565 [Candidatus Nanohaloarchaea archaeon]